MRRLCPPAHGSSGQGTASATTLSTTDKARSGPLTTLVRKLSAAAALAASALLAADAIAVDTAVAPPGSPARAGETIAIPVLFTNPAADPVSFTPPGALSGEWRQDGRRYPATLKLKAGSATELTAGGRVVLRYRAVVPRAVDDGPLTLQLTGREADPLMLLARAQPTGRAAERSDAEPLLRRSEDGAVTRESFLDNLFAYRPMYFLAGPDPANAKFQLSLKYRVIDDDSDLGRNHAWLQGFFLGYTQTSFWDLSRESFPFEDTNFKPEAFYQFRGVPWPALGANARTDVQAGFQHKSNGRGGMDSRSLNRAYLEPAVHLRIDTDTRLSLRPRVWQYTGGLSDNPDIRRFRGRSSLTATVSHRDSWQAGAYVRGNPSAGRGAVRLDASYPLDRVTNDNLDFYVHGQVFSGYSENLLNFDEKDTRFRLGVSIVR